MLAAFLLAFGIAAAKEAAVPPPVVDRIELSGVTFITQADVEAAMEVEVGAALDQKKLARTVDNLMSVYRSKGHYSPKIAGTLARAKGEGGRRETVLTFSVKEGLPTRIAGARFIAEPRPADFTDEQWRSIEGRLADRLLDLEGQVLDQERLVSVARVIRDVLGAEEYIGVRSDDIRVIPAPIPVSEAGMKAADQWVVVEFRIDLGERVSFGYRGNSALSVGELRSLVEEQKVLGFGKDYVSAIRGRIEEEYRNRGYARVRVLPYTYDDPGRRGRRVTYQIEEGERIRVAGVSFDGNLVFPVDRLREQFFRGAPFLVRKGWYSAKDAELAAQALVDWMKSQGYLYAKLVTVTSRYGRGAAAVSLVIYLYEGDQTVVREVSVSGARVIPVEEVQRILRVQSGEPLNLFAFTSGLEELKSEYRERGYLDAAIANEGGEGIVRYAEENRYADIALEVQEGAEFKVSRIDVEGLAGTSPAVVDREIRVHPGEVIDERKLSETEARLKRLDIFSAVVVKTVDDPENPGHKIVKVAVEEGTPGILRGGVGFRNDLGIRFFGQAGYTNLWRRRHTVSLVGSVNRRFERFHFVEGRLELSYLWPWVFLGDTNLRPALSIEKTQYTGFNAYSRSASLGMDRRILSDVDLRGGLAYSIEAIEQFGATTCPGITDPADCIDNGSFRIGGLTPSVRLDLRDDKLVPTRGIFANTSFELASPYLFSESHLGYYRFQARADFYHPLFRDLVWMVSLRTGHEGSTEVPVSCAGQPSDCKADPTRDRTGAIPLVKQFALGGIGSVRGLDEQGINYYDTAIYGTLSFVNYRTQIELPLAKPLMLGLFLDAGNLTLDHYSLTEDMRYGSGFGLHYQTPVGSINADLGFNLAPRVRRDGQHEDAYKFYFSVGVI